MTNFYNLVDTDWLQKIVDNPDQYLQATVRAAQIELNSRNNDNTFKR